VDWLLPSGLLELVGSAMSIKLFRLSLNWEWILPDPSRARLQTLQEMTEGV
jgi:hypothetical protein